MENTQEFTLTLNVNDVNTIVAVLGEAPYKISAPLLQKLEEQLQPQVVQDAGNNAAEK